MGAALSLLFSGGHSQLLQVDSYHCRTPPGRGMMMPFKLNVEQVFAFIVRA